MKKYLLILVLITSFLACSTDDSTTEPIIENPATPTPIESYCGLERNDYLGTYRVREYRIAYILTSGPVYELFTTYEVLATAGANDNEIIFSGLFFKYAIPSNQYDQWGHELPLLVNINVFLNESNNTPPTLTFRDYTENFLSMGGLTSDPKYLYFKGSEGTSTCDMKFNFKGQVMSRGTIVQPNTYYSIITVKFELTKL